jgi:hypothetical protein
VISHPAGTVARFPDDGFIVRNGGWRLTDAEPMVVTSFRLAE